MIRWFKESPDRLCLPLAVIIAVIAVIVLPSCGVEDAQTLRALEQSKAFNGEAIKKPEFVGCLPDGRALFRLDLKGPDNWAEDRVYITLDGQATAATTRRSGKSTKYESVAWPISNDVKPELLDPCTKSEEATNE